MIPTMEVMRMREVMTPEQVADYLQLNKDSVPPTSSHLPACIQIRSGSHHPRWCRRGHPEMEDMAARPVTH